LRLIAEDISITFDDIVMGKQTQNIKSECGDFIIKRRDGLFAYQLAVVVDDAIQNISEVVRGTDLLDSTPRQIYLQRLLGYPTPAYCHLPLAVDPAGNKISKSEGKSKIEIAHREELLISTLDFLGQQAPGELSGSGIEDIWRWAMDNWDVARIPTSKTIQL
jgi:glutamyl-Q tRNA(Asp) synthetase